MIRQVALAVLVVGLYGCGKSSSSDNGNGTPRPYSVVMSSGWSPAQVVGQHTDLTINAQNIGDSVPHLALVFDNLAPTWRIDSASACGQKATLLKRYQHSLAVDFGLLKRKQICILTIHTTAVQPSTSSQPVFVRSFGAVLDNRVDDKVPVNGGMELLANVSPAP